MAGRFDDVLDEVEAERADGPAVADASPAGAPEGAGRFDDVFDDIEREKKERENMAVHSARLIPPEEAASVLELSNWSGFNPDIVARNRDEMAMRKKREDSGFEVLRNSAPITTAWVTENPHRAALSLEDMRNLANVEKTFDDYGFVTGLRKAFFQTGMLNLAKMGVQAPGGLAESASGPANLLAKMPSDTTRQKVTKAALTAALLPTPFGQAIATREAMAKTSGDKGIELKAPDWMLDNGITKYIDEKAAQSAPWELTASGKDALKAGDYTKAGRILAVNVAASAPTTALILAASALTGGVGAGVALGGIGAGSAGEKSAQARAAGAPTAEGQLAALGTGVSETASEAVGALLPLKAWGEAIAKQFGKAVTLQTFKAFAKTIAYSTGTEMTEEGVNSIAQKLTDLATGVDPKAFGPGWYEDTIKSMAVGGLGGAGPTTIMAIPAAIAIRAQDVRIKQARDFYTALGDSVEASKALARLPQARRELVEKMTAGSPVKDILIPVEAFETYFQGANQDPIAFAREVGAQESYETAKENGGYVKIPTAVWAEKVVGTDHYRALADDIKFSANEMTVNESKKFREEMQKEADARQPDMESAGKVYDDFKAKAVSAGLSPQEADAHAVLMAKRAARRAQILGEDAFSLYERENINVGRSASPSALANAAPSGTTPAGSSAAPAVPGLPSDWQTGPARAIFRGWQEMGEGVPAQPIYNIIGDHPRQRSTVGAETLGTLGIPVPYTPTMEEWKSSGGPTGLAGPTLAPRGTSGSESHQGDQAIQRDPQPNQGKSPETRPAKETSPVTQLASSLESISQHPDFVKLKFDNDAVLGKYAKEDGVEVTPEFEKQLFVRLHDAVGALRKAKHMGDIDVQNGIMAKYPDIANEWMTVMFKNWAQGSVDTFNKLVAGKYGNARPAVAVELERATSAASAPAEGPTTEAKPKPKVKRKRVKEIAESLMKDAVSEFETESESYSRWRSLIKNGISRVSRNGQETDLGGEYDTLPLHMKNKDGVFVDDLAVLAVEEGLIRDGKDIFDVLRNLKSPRSPIRDTAYYEGEATRIAEYEVENESIAAQSPIPDEESFFQSQTGDLFPDVKENVADSFARLVAQNVKKGLSVPDAIRAAKERLAESARAASNADRSAGAKQREFGVAGGVQGFGTTTQNQSEFFQSANQDQTQTPEFEPAQGTTAPVFYSQLQKTIEDKMPNAAPVAMVRNLLDPAKGNVKSEEVEWSGINDFLAGKEKVTKAELLDFLKSNEVQIEEVVKGGKTALSRSMELYLEGRKKPTTPTEWADLSIALEKIAQKTDSIETSQRYYRLSDEATRVSENLGPDGSTTGQPKFAQYQTAGGENYREILLTLPEKLHEGKTAQQRYNELIALGNPEFEARRIVEEKWPSAFRSSHFDEPNIIAHVRMNDRTTQDGKKVLFLEEVQSDWHQQGREKGYGDKQGFHVSGNNQVWKTFGSRHEAESYLKEMQSQYPSGRFEITEFNQQGTVPNAPFKKTWHELALKRMLRYAVDNGYDGIAWTTGEQQAERYDLSKQVSQIEYAKPEGDSGAHLLVRGIGRDSVIDREVKPSQLPEFVGKDMARKIMETAPGENGYVKISGLDLKLGGEGMKGFYDQIIPAFLNKYTKKWGGRVGETKIASEAEWTGKGPVPAEVVQALKKLDDLGFNYRGEAAAAILEHSDFATRWDVPPAEAAIFQKWRDEALPANTNVHSLEITPAMRDSVAQGQPMFQGQGGDPRAQVRFGNQSINIDLFKNADLSSLLHEMSHVFAKEMGQDLDVVRAKDPASLTLEQRQFVQDAESLLKWVKADSFAAMTTAQHEQVAKGMEAYFREGKAPSAELQGAFARFREWLLIIYQSIAGLGVELNPEVREVFDRMFASQEEIAAAQSEMGTRPLFADAKAVGMSDAEAERYAKALAAARAAGEEELATKIMAEMKRKEMKPYLDRREQVKAEVTGEVNRRIEYIAMSVLQRGALPDGQRAPEGFTPVKLSRKAIVESYGEEHLDLLPKPYVYSRQGGIHPDEAAAIFGFADGQELLTALENAQPKEQVIEDLVNARMKAEFGDMRTDGTIAAEAMKAVHNDKRAELLKAEMDHLVSDDFAAFKNVVRRVTRPVPSVADVRAQARAAIGRMTVRDIYPVAYQRAESKASRDAVEAMLKGDMEAAFTAKLRERLNHELFRAATDARESVDDMVDYFKKFDKPEVRERIGKAGGTYLEQIEALLERFDFRKSTTLKSLDKRKSLVQWVAEQTEAGFAVDVPQELLNEANRRHYKDTPFETLEKLDETVRSIEHLAGLKNRLLANDRARTVDEAINDITASVTAHHTVNNEPVPIEPTLKERFLDKPAEFLASHAKMEFIVELLDGDQKLGPTFRHIIEPLLKAGDDEANRIHDASKALEEIFDAYTKKERATWYYKKIKIPMLNQSLYKPTILSIALNQGNPYNKEAVLEGMRGLGYSDWTQDHIDAVLNTLDARDIEVVNKIWALINSYWPDASALEKRINGVAPEKVVGAPVMLKNGTLNGGYYPIKFDHKRDWVSMKRLEEQLAKGVMGGHWAKSMTRQGHLKERTNTGGKPIRLDLGVINEHIQDVVHDITHREAVIDVNRIVNDERFRDLMVKTIGTSFYKEFQPWLNSIAGQVNTESLSWLESLASHAKKGVTVVALGLKVSSGLMQIAGYGNTVKEIGEKYALIGLKKMGSQGINIKTLWDEISEKSVEMKYRLSTYDRDVKETMSKLNVAGTKRGLLSVPEMWTADAYKAYFGLIGFMDLAVSVPTWIGAYEKAMDGKVKGIEKADEKSAVLYADKVVRMTQSANRVMDLARVQRGNQVQKLFTMFYSQMSIQYNQFMKTGMGLKMGLKGSKSDVIRAFFYMMFVQAVITDFIRGGGGGGDEDDDRWFRIAKDMAFIPMETMIVMRDIANGLERFGYSGSPAFDVAETLTKATKAVGARAFGDKDELTASDWKNIVKTFGYTFALPTGQAWKTAEYLHAWMQGDVEPDNAVQGMWQALVTGKPKER